MSRKEAPLVEVRAMGAPPLRTTSEHPFYARLRRRIWNNEERRYERVFDAPEWVEASRLTSNHFVAQLTDEGSGDEGKSLAFWYLIGRWLGDGWLVDHKRTSKIPQGKRGSRVTSRVHKAIICCAHEEAEELARRIAESGFTATASREQTVTKFHISSAELVEFLRPFGRGAANKRLPGFVFGLSREAQASLFRGWVESDGCTLPNGAIQGTTISERLGHGLARLARNALRRPVGLYLSKVPDTCTIEGRVVRQRSRYQLRISPSRHEGFYEEGFCWVPVRAVRSLDERADVFNIEVSDDNSYIANSYVVHNCEDTSAAGKGAGLNGARSGLWFEYRRVVSELRPPWVVVENVASGADLWVNAIQDELGGAGYVCFPVPIAAADCGAPHERARIFIIARNADSDSKPMVPEHGEAPAVRAPTRGLPGWAIRPSVRVDDGLPSRLDASLRAFGNAVVPQCAEVIGHIIRELAQAEEE
jgi:hypothetical protein